MMKKKRRTRINPPKLSGRKSLSSPLDEEAFFSLSFFLLSVVFLSLAREKNAARKNCTKTLNTSFFILPAEFLRVPTHNKTRAQVKRRLNRRYNTRRLKEEESEREREFALLLSPSVIFHSRRSRE